MRLLIIGASRGIGLETVRQALDRGHMVRAFSRSAGNIAIDHSNLEKVSGNAQNLEDVSAALTGVDVVVETIGVAINPQTILFGTDLFSRAGRVIVEAMKAHGPKRLIVITGLGAGDARDRLGPLFAVGFQLSLKRIYDDKDIEEQIIKTSGLEWTILRPGLLRDGPMTGVYQVLTEPETWKVGPIRRADVAHCILEEAENGEFMHQTPLLIE